AHGLSNEEYSKRTAAAQQKLLAADQILTGLSEYEALRDRYIFSKDNLHKRASEALADSNRWLSQWKSYLLNFDNADISNYESFLSSSQQFFDSQSKALHEIETKIERIRRISVDSQGQIDFTYSSTAQLNASQQASVTNLQSVFEQLRSSIFRINQNARDQMGLLRLIQQTSVDALKMKVKQRLLAQSSIPLESGIARFEAMMEEAKLMGPLKYKLEKTAKEMSQHSLNFALQHAKRLRTEATNLCRDSRSTITNSSASAASKANGLNAVNRLCGAIDTSWLALAQSGLNDREMAFEFGSIMKVKYESRCRTGDPGLDCAEFRAVSAVPKSFYDAASDVEIKDIEYRWASIETLER
ncbi:MAG: hypothetical protein M3Q07_01390, partial [Pseudobdellovibrionaceae bacterium]|nr:hypothetical protein [Pseudobdellovibrionaceae bacterium]